MGKEERLQQLQAKARQLGKDLRDLVTHVEQQQEWQRGQLEMWAERMSNLLTFLMNFEQYLELDDGLDGEGHGPADPGGGG